jgi:hypothetical protein
MLVFVGRSPSKPSEAIAATPLGSVAAEPQIDDTNGSFGLNRTPSNKLTSWSGRARATAT